MQGQVVFNPHSKLWLVIGLLHNRFWYYPLTLVGFDLFVTYQVYRFAFTHSLWLIAKTLIDMVIIVLTWHEYRVQMALKAQIRR